MPTVNANSKTRVLVTGANGYVAMWVVRALLEQGYIVRGTVRSEDKGRKLAAYFETAPYANRFEWAVVEDITAGGAFDEAIQNVDAIEHIASPAGPVTDDPDDFIQPAVQGTTGILQSALKYGSIIKRIVITSTIGTMLKANADPTFVRKVDENDWADEHVEAVNKLGKEAPFLTKYRASKVLAERAAWEFYDKHKEDVNWDVVVLNPTLVLGPPLQDFKVLADLNSSLSYWFTHVFKDQSEETLKGSYGHIDISDVAAAHVEALRKEAVAGHRVIVSEGMATWQQTRNLIKSVRPNLWSSGPPPCEDPHFESKIQLPFDPAQGKQMLGPEYKSFEVIVQRTFAYFEEKGWINVMENF